MVSSLQPPFWLWLTGLPGRSVFRDSYWRSPIAWWPCHYSKIGTRSLATFYSSSPREQHHHFRINGAGLTWNSLPACRLGGGEHIRHEDWGKSVKPISPRPLLSLAIKQSNSWYWFCIASFVVGKVHIVCDNCVLGNSRYSWHVYIQTEQTKYSGDFLWRFLDLLNIGIGWT